MSYVDIDEALGYFPVLLESVKNHSRLEGIFKEFLNDASRLFESETRVQQGHYAKTTGEVEVKKFYTNGTSFLHISPVLQVDAISYPDESVVDIAFYDLIDSQTILFNDFFCQINPFLKRSFVNIEGIWGYPCTPEDVKVAIKSLAVLLMHNAPLSRLDVEFVLSEQYVNVLRFNYDSIVKKYQIINAEVKLIPTFKIPE